MANRFALTIEGVEASLAGQYATELQKELEQAEPTLGVSPGPNDPARMDFGSTLVLVLGTPVAIAIAQGIKSFIDRRGVRVVVTSGGKKVELTNMRSQDIEAALKSASGV